MDNSSGILPATIAADMAGGELEGISGIIDSGEILDAGIDDMDILQTTDEGRMRPKRTPTNKFNVAIIIAAALVFIVVIAWFEVIRVWLTYAFNTSTALIFNKALGDTVYAVIATIIAIFLVWLLMKFWIKSDR